MKSRITKAIDIAIFATVLLALLGRVLMWHLSPKSVPAPLRKD